MENPTSLLEIISIVAAIFSVALGMIAIWLSYTFYKWSSEYSEGIKAASDSVEAGVKRLETLFDKLYADTFTMMKDTVSDMRKHIWSGEGDGTTSLVEAEQKADAKIAELQKGFEVELSRILDQQSVNAEHISEVRREMRELVSRVINETRKVESEALGETIQNAIFSCLKNWGGRNGGMRYMSLLDVLSLDFSEDQIYREVERMLRTGKLKKTGSQQTIDLYDRIDINDKLATK